jgi:predicted hydrocarbon binding protein
MKNAVDLLLGGGRRTNSESSVLLMRTDSFQSMLKYFTITFGASGLTMIYSMGEANGKYETRQMKGELRSLEAPIIKQQLIEKSLWRLTSMGWGDFKLDSLDPIKCQATIKISINPFSENCKSTDAGGCYYLQGYIAGVISEALNEDITYKETRCSKTEEGSCELNLMSIKGQDNK